MSKKLIATSICVGFAVLASLALGVYGFCEINNMKKVDYGINVVGTQVTSANANNVLDGVSYDASSNVLTLKDANLEGDTFGILSNRNLVLRLVGDNTITLNATDETVVGIDLSDGFFRYDLCSIGSGALTINILNDNDSIDGIKADDILMNGGAYRLNLGNATAISGMEAENLDIVYPASLRINTGNGDIVSGMLINNDISFIASNVAVTIGNGSMMTSGIIAYNDIKITRSNIGVNVGSGKYVTGLSADGTINMIGNNGDDVVDPVFENASKDYDSNVLVLTGNGENENNAVFAGNKLVQTGGFLQAITGNCTSDDNNAIFVQGLANFSGGEVYAKSGAGLTSSQALMCESNLIIDANVLRFFGGTAQESYGAAVYGHVYLLSGIMRFESAQAEFVSVGLYVKGSLEIIDANVGCWASEVTDASGESYGLWCNSAFDLYNDSFFTTGHTKAINSEINIKLDSYKVHYSDQAGDVAEDNINVVENPTSFDYGAYKYILFEAIV